MKIESHIVSENGDCACCGVTFPPIHHDGEPERLPIKPGDRIGLISGLSTGPSAYLIKKVYFDSNQLCA
jgi:hypothetical protein